MQENKSVLLNKEKGTKDCHATESTWATKKLYPISLYWLVRNASPVRGHKMESLLYHCSHMYVWYSNLQKRTCSFSIGLRVSAYPQQTGFVTAHFNLLTQPDSPETAITREFGMTPTFLTSSQPSSRGPPSSQLEIPTSRIIAPGFFVHHLGDMSNQAKRVPCPSLQWASMHLSPSLIGPWWPLSPSWVSQVVSAKEAFSSRRVQALIPTSLQERKAHKKYSKGL